jgi:hypothetical protein
MSWTDTHERYRIVTEVIDAAARRRDGRLVWREEYAPYFGTVEGLVAFLAQRWQRTCEAQLDPTLRADQVREQHRKILSDNAVLLQILDHYRAPALQAVPAATVA